MGNVAVSMVQLKCLVEQVREKTTEIIQFDSCTNFVADLHLTSLELIGLVFLCEQTFDVNLVDEPGLLTKLHTVGKAVEAIGELQRRSAALCDTVVDLGDRE